MSGFVSIGECMIELSARNGQCYHLGFAGDTFNTAWYVRGSLPYGYQVRYFTGFGDDLFSNEQREFFENNGIDVSYCVTIPGAQPGLYVVTLDEAGERTFTYWREVSAARNMGVSPARIRDCLVGADVAFFSGITLAILDVETREIVLDSLRVSREFGVRVAFDPNYRSRLWSEPGEARYWYNQAQRVSDIILATYDDEAELYSDVSPESAIDRLASNGPTEIIIKNGGDYAALWYGRGVQRVSAFKASVRDTTGAGDSFNGAYIASRIVGRDPLSSVHFGHHVAAKVVGKYGALMELRDVIELTRGVTHG